MLILLSPAKKQQHGSIDFASNFTQPQAIAQIKTLISVLKKQSKSKLAKLMSVSDKLADLNYSRFQAFDPNTFTLKNSTPAVFAFQGDAYQTLNVSDFNKKEIAYLQEHLIILSGLYGYLRPLDLIQAYRLEMKTALKTEQAGDLYHFWGDEITKGINAELQSHKNKAVINLASNEYFKAINAKKLDARIVQIDFKERKDGTYKTVGIHAKRARGTMTRYLVKNRIDNIDDLKAFSELQYAYSEQHSSDDSLVFVR